MSKKTAPRDLADNEAKAFSASIRISPQKLNLVAASIRGLAVQSALTQLTFSKRRIAQDVKKVLQSAIANAYFQILADRLMTKAEPTDADLRAFYDDYVLQAKAANQAAGLPTFEQVKAQLPGAWKRKQGQQAQQALLLQLNQKCPVVFAPDYRPTQMP